jgi:predicted enzyme related to lactoylglutathione lyase
MSESAFPATNRQPAIVSPVSRHLFVSDAGRSVAFYHDILGFEPQELRATYGLPTVAEVVSGPARIQFGTHAGGVAPSRKTLCFETDDVAAMRASIIARGGQPGEMDRVNWIKMEMFELRDPDGHTLWFGQSFDRPGSPRPEPMLLQALPELPLNDVAAGVAYYRDVLGFKINYAQHDVGVMDRDSITVVLIARDERRSGIGSCYVYIKDADALHAELTAKGAKVLDQPISMPWGLRQFHVADLEDNRITFGQPFE